MTTKTCTGCGETKTTDRFSKHRSKRDGLQSRCKTCLNADNRVYRKANRDRVNARARAYREANLDKENARGRAYKEKHREELAAYNRAYYEANRDRENARNRARRALIGKPEQDRVREITSRYATRSGEPWTPEEDRYILTGPGTYIDKALQLSRTHSAVAVRANRLRQDNAA